MVQEGAYDFDYVLLNIYIILEMTNIIHNCLFPSRNMLYLYI